MKNRIEETIKIAMQLSHKTKEEIENTQIIQELKDNNYVYLYDSIPANIYDILQELKVSFDISSIVEATSYLYKKGVY